LLFEGAVLRLRRTLLAYRENLSIWRSSAAHFFVL
jgi:hypothetical protein